MPGQYLSFIDSLPGSMILTFNWDTVIEHLMDRQDRPYVFDFESKFETDAVPIIKLHGSIDWFLNPYPERLKEWMHLTPLSNLHENNIVRAKNNPLPYYEDHWSPMIVVPGYDKTNQMKQLQLTTHQSQYTAK